MNTEITLLTHNNAKSHVAEPAPLASGMWKDAPPSNGAVASAGKRLVPETPFSVGAPGVAARPPPPSISIGCSQMTKAAVVARIGEIERILEGMGADSEYCSSYFAKMAGGCVCRWGVCEKHIRGIPPLPRHLIPSAEYYLHIGELKGQMQLLSNAGISRRKMLEQLQKNEAADSFLVSEGGAGGSSTRQVRIVFVLVHIFWVDVYVLAGSRRPSRSSVPSSRISSGTTWG